MGRGPTTPKIHEERLRIPESWVGSIHCLARPSFGNFLREVTTY